MKQILIVFLVVAVGVGAYIVLRPHDTGMPEHSMTPMPSMSTTPSSTPKPTKTPAPTPTPTKTPGITVQEVQTHHIAISNSTFSPSTLTVKKGDLVIFTNQDTTAHTATSVNGKFDSGTMLNGVTWTLETANLPAGTYQYLCSFHLNMRGTIVVTQ